MATWRRARRSLDQLLKSPPKVSSLGDTGTYLPGDAIEEEGWGDGMLTVATFRPFHYGVGLGPAQVTGPSDGVVEVR